MKRVMIVGGPGSGKSTLAVEMGRITGLPVHHMDMIHWQPGWKERSREEKIELVKKIENSREWILEGGLSVTYGSRAAHADTIVWLDLPLVLRLLRVLKRRWQYRGGQTRPDLPEDCPEKLDWAFLHWILTNSRKSNQKIERAIGAAPHLDVFHLHTRQEVDDFLAANRK